MRRASAIFMLLTLTGVGWAQWNNDGQQCFDLTRPETFQPDKALPYCNRAIESGELIDRNLATVYYYRANIYAYKKDYKRAISDYEEATRRDPSMTQAHNARGFARFFLGQYEAAAKDFQESSEWKGDDVYTLLWRYIVQARTGGEAANNLERWAKDKDFAEWPGQLIYVYRGKLSPQEALRAADDPSPKRQREKKCEAYFYLGELLLTQGKKTEAIKMFRAAVATNVTGFVEYEAAKAELKRLGA